MVLFPPGTNDFYDWCTRKYKVGDSIERDSQKMNILSVDETAVTTQIPGKDYYTMPAPMGNISKWLEKHKDREEYAIFLNEYKAHHSTYILGIEDPDPLDVYEWIREVKNGRYFGNARTIGLFKVVGENWYTKTICFCKIDEYDNIIENEKSIDICFSDKNALKETMYKVLERCYVRACIEEIMSNVKGISNNAKKLINTWSTNF